MARAAALETARLTKFYGKTRGIEDLDLRVEEGEVFGYLGPNGAGKTTTIRLLLDLIRPTSGSASIAGHDTRTASVDVRRVIGYLPGELRLPTRVTALHYLSFLGGLRGGIGVIAVSGWERFKGGTLPGGTVPGGTLPGGTLPGGMLPGGTLEGGPL